MSFHCSFRNFENHRDEKVYNSMLHTDERNLWMKNNCNYSFLIFLKTLVYFLSGYDLIGLKRTESS